MTVCACAALIAALSGCATTMSSNAVTVTGQTLSIYASQPPGATGGQQAQDVLAAERLAFNQTGDQVGKFKIKFVPVHGAELSDNPRAAIEDTSTVAYLGELVPGTSWISIEITNELGVLEVSPTDTAVFLTQGTPAVPGAPGKYFPTSKTYGRTFGRVAPTTAQEAKAQVQEMHAMHVTKLYVVEDGQPYGVAIALQVKQDAAAAGISASEGPATATGFTGSGADALFLGASSQDTAKRVFDEVAAASPSARLFAPSALYDDAFASTLAPAAQRNLVISSPGFLKADLPPAGVTFVSQFKHAYGHAPAPAAIFGYEAMAAVLAVIREAGATANNRSELVHEFMTIKNRASVLGTYSISSGDTSLAPFVFSRFVGGKLVPDKFVQAQG